MCVCSLDDDFEEGKDGDDGEQRQQQQQRLFRKKRRGRRNTDDDGFFDKETEQNEHGDHNRCVCFFFQFFSFPVNTTLSLDF